MSGATAAVACYGEWLSPVGLDVVATESGSVSWPSAVGDETWWCCSDPASATVRLLRAIDTEPVEVLVRHWSVRNRSLGYGGRPYLVVRSDGDADLVLAPDAAKICCVREVSATAAGPHDDPAPRTHRDIVAVALDGSDRDDPSAVRIVASSHHFLGGVRPSPDGRRLAWIGWDHPAMPWEATELMVADLVAGPDGLMVGPAVRVLGGDDVSVPQAEWDGPGALYAMADPDGWRATWRATRRGRRWRTRTESPVRWSCCRAPTMSSVRPSRRRPSSIRSPRAGCGTATWSSPARGTVSGWTAACADSLLAEAELYSHAMGITVELGEK